MRIIIAFLLICSTSLATPPPTVQVSKRQINATVFIVSGNASGSGTLIGKFGLILTAKHLGDEPVRVFTADDMPHSAIPVRFTEHGDGPAFYLIQDIKRLNTSCAEYVNVSTRIPSKGDVITVLGFPADPFDTLHLTVAEGETIGGRNNLQSTSPGGGIVTYPGNIIKTTMNSGASGGGAYGTMGDIVGCILAVNKQEKYAVICSYNEMVSVLRQIDISEFTGDNMEAYSGAGDVVDVYTTNSGSCIPCNRFRRDLENGVFRGYRFQMHYQEVEGHRYETPTFVFGGQRIKGYGERDGRRTLIAFLENVSRSQPSDRHQYDDSWSSPPPRFWPFNGPRGGRGNYQFDDSEQQQAQGGVVDIDWSGVKAFVLVKNDNPMLRRFLGQGAQLALNRLTGNQVHLDIIPETEQPQRFAALSAAMGLDGGEWTQWPVISFEKIVDKGFIRNLILKRIEDEVADLGFDESEFFPTLIFRRNNPRQWAAVNDALQVVEVAAPEESSEPPGHHGIQAIIIALFAALVHVVWSFVAGCWAWLLYLLHKVGLVSERKLSSLAEKTAAVTAATVVKSQAAAPRTQPEPVPPAPAA